MNHDQTPRWDNDQTSEAPTALPDLAPSAPAEIMPPRLSLFEQASDDDEETEPGAAKKKKRFRKLFKRIFPSIAEKEETANPETSIRDQLFGEVKPATPLAEQIPLESRLTTESSHADEEVRAGYEEQPTPLESSIETPLAEESEIANAEPVPREPLDQKDVSPAADPVFEVPPELIVPPLPQQAQADSQPIVHSPVASEAVPQSRVERVEQNDTGIKAAILAAGATIVGGDFFQRRRMRRLKKRTKQLEQKSDQQQKELNRQKKTQTELKNELQQQQLTRAEQNNNFQQSQSALVERAPSVGRQTVLESRPVVTPALERSSPEQPRQEAQSRPSFWSSPESSRPEQRAAPVNERAPKEDDAGEKVIPEPEEEPVQPLRKEKEKKPERPVSIIPEQKTKIIDDPEKIKETDFDRHEVMDEASGPQLAAVSVPPKVSQPTAIKQIIEQKRREVSDNPGSKIEYQVESAHSLASGTPQRTMYRQSANIGATVGVIIATAVIAIYSLI